MRQAMRLPYKICPLIADLCPLILLPPDLPPLVLFLQPALQWLEVFGHRTGGNIFPGRFL